MSFYSKQKYEPDMTFYQEISKYLEFELTFEREIVKSGQRAVYFCSSDGENYVFKVSKHHPTSVSRIKREIKILEEINSPYFPKISKNYFVTDKELEYFLENLEDQNPDLCKSLSSKQIDPFFVTIEKYIEHHKWDDNLVAKLQDIKLLIQIVEHIFNGLNVLWNKSIVHRDIKPENILIKHDMMPVVIDLGIAKSFGDNTQTLTPMLAHAPCTPPFASPEQLNNDKKNISYKSDQFSVGVVIYLILTNRFPFGSFQDEDYLTILKNMKDRNFTLLSEARDDIPNELCRFVSTLLSYYPYERFRTHKQIEEELEKTMEKL